MKEIFQHKYVKRHFAARIISNFGNGISPIALAFGILHLPNGSATLLGWVLGSTTISMIIVSPFGGVLADKYGRVRMVALCDIWGAVGLFVQVAFFATGHVPLWVLLFANINFGIMWGIWWPAFTGVLPALMPEEDLQKGNALNALASNGASIVGAAAAGFLVSAYGSTVALGIDAVTFLIAGLIVFSFRHVVPARGESDNTVIDDLVHGWKVFLSFRWIVIVVAGFSFLFLCWAGAENVLGPLIALKHFNGPKSWAIVLSAESVGFLIGSLIAIRVTFKYPLRATIIMNAALSLYIWSLAKPQSLAFIAVCAFLWGITADLLGTIWGTALQRLVPRESLSRVSAFDAMGTLLFRPVGLAIAAPLAGLIGIDHTLEAGAVLTLVAIIAMIAVPEVRNVQFDLKEIKPDPSSN
ncbi:MAG: MFS transporter [Actinomycetes bacterium]